MKMPSVSALHRESCCDAFSEPHLSGSACVMSMRGRETMGRLVGLLRVTGSSSGVRGRALSLSFSACRHDNGGNCRLPEKRRCTLHTSTPRVLPAENCPTGGSVFSWKQRNVWIIAFDVKWTKPPEDEKMGVKMFRGCSDLCERVMF